MVRSYYRRGYKRRYSPRYRRSSLYRVPRSLPTETGLVRHTYVHNSYLSVRDPLGGTVAAGTATHKFAINDLYDPDITGVGSSATGFSLLSSLYSQYVVVAAKMSVRMRPYSASCVAFTVNTSAWSISPVQLSLCLCQDPTTNPVPYGSYGTLQTDRYLKALTLTAGVGNTFPFNVRRLSVWYSPLKFWGATWRENIDQLSGYAPGYGSWDPALRAAAWYNQDAQMGTAGTDYGQWFVEFRIDFWAKWFQNKPTRPTLLTDIDKDTLEALEKEDD